MRLDSRLPWSVAYDFCVWYFLEGLGEYHEVPYKFYEVADLYPDVPEEVLYG